MISPSPRVLSSALAALATVTAAERASAQDAAFVTTVGKDTLSFERYGRTGNVVTGSWVVLHAPGVYVHDYRMTLDTGGLPVHYAMKYCVPLADARPSLDSVIVDYTRDTVAYCFVTRDSTFGRKFAVHEAFPFLGQSVVGLDVTLRRLRATHADSGTIVAHEPSNLVRPTRTLAVRLAGDSAYVGATSRVHVAADGGVIDVDDGRMSVRAAPSLDVAELTKHFVNTYAPRMAALREAAASRQEITLPTTQLDRFVGRYGNGAVSITRDGERLVLVLPPAKVTLLAMSRTEFFARTPDLVLTFDFNAADDLGGLTITQGENKQRFARDRQ
jgi:hypothetical protein